MGFGPTTFTDERYLFNPAIETRDTVYDFTTNSNVVNFTVGKLQIDGTAITATAAELNFIDVTAGTGAASKAVVLDSGDDYTWPAAGILTMSHLVGNADPMDITGLAGSAGAGGAITVVTGLGDAATNAGGVLNLTTASGGLATTTTAGASGALNINSATGGVASGATGAGGASGAVAIASGAGGAATDTAAGVETGGASGAVSLISGTGGAIDNLSTGTAGAAGDVTITSGTGGGADAASSTGGAAGDVVITAGTGGASASGTAGQDGVIKLQRNAVLPILTHQPASQTATTTATLTVAQILGGILEGTPSSAAAVYTLPTGTALTAEFTGLVAGDSFDLVVINKSSTGGDTISMTDGDDISTVGDIDIDATDAIFQRSEGVFRFKWTTGNVWVMYRVG